MALRTRLCDVLGIDVPIVQAPVTSDPRLPLAVAAAGGLGMLQAWYIEPAAVAGLVESVAGSAVGFNLVLEWPQEDRLERALEAGAQVVSFFWGDPAALIARAHDAGATAFAAAASAEEAKRVADAGADVVVAQGWEAGGHVWGEVGAMALIPAVVDAVDVPVVAAGGIGDGRGVAAALALGADGVWLGTRFVASEECTQVYRERIVAARETDAVYTDVFSEGWEAPHRALRNAALESGVRHGRSTPRSEAELETAALYAGQSAGVVRAIQPVAEIVRTLVADAERALGAVHR